MENGWIEINNNIEKYLEDIIHEYRMKVIKIGPLSTALVGRGFALVITIDRFSADVSYLFRDKSNELILLPCGNFFAEKFTKEDRENLIQNNNAVDIIINDLIIINKGLVNKWSNVLKGDTSWINDFVASKWNEKMRLTSEEEQIIEKYI